MPGQEITPQLRLFIHETINSVEQLEVLLFMVSNPEQEWTAEEVGERIRAQLDSVSEKLESLHEAQLLAKRAESSPRYRYSPGNSALENEVADSLTRAYREGKDTLIQLIYSRPLANIRYFADAFRLRKEED